MSEPGSLLVAITSALVIATIPAQAAPDDELARAGVVYGRGGALYRSDARGKGETQLATLSKGATVRALHTDAAGKVLLVERLDAGGIGTWAWLALDGSHALADLPCADGPAQLAQDGSCVLCRARSSGSVIVNLGSGKVTPIGIPAVGARLVGQGALRQLIWADPGGVWAAPPTKLTAKRLVAPQAPTRGFLPSPDGKRAIGVYPDRIHDSGKATTPADVLMGFALDGEGARRKALRDGIPLDWSHDGEYVLIQDGGSACLVRALGGQYKCWKGYQAVGLSADGSYALMVSKPAPAPATKPGTPATKPGKAPPPPSEREPADPAGTRGDDVPLPLPTGVLGLYRGKLAGPYTEAPTLIVKTVEGAAVWVPAVGP